MKKLAYITTASSLLALATAPAFAQQHNVSHGTHPFHTLAVPTICEFDQCAVSTAQWVTDHFHHALFLELTAADSCVTGATPADFLNSGAEAGAHVTGVKGQPITDFSFDYRTEYCGATNGQHFVFVYVTTTDGDTFMQECEYFPNPHTGDVFINEHFTRDGMNLPEGSKYDTLFIGLFNQSQLSGGDAQLRNITVGGLPSTPDLVKATTFCVDVSLMCD